LGRSVGDEDECMSPDKVDLSDKVVMVSAGDSHTAALSRDGRVYIWGTFRVSGLFVIVVFVLARNSKSSYQMASEFKNTK